MPVNNDFEPTADGVEIMVISTAIHADLVLPIRNETVDWSLHLPSSDFKGDVSRATHVAIRTPVAVRFPDCRTCRAA